jgi:hypothetical protein
VPHLAEPLVRFSLERGLQLVDPSWSWDCGRPPYTVGVPRGGPPPAETLDWYRPMGCCHSVCFFAMSIGVLNFPGLRWRFLSGALHTVVVGADRAGRDALVLDLTMFDRLRAAGALACASRPGVWRPAGGTGNDWRRLTESFVDVVVPRLREQARRRRR